MTSPMYGIGSSGNLNVVGAYDPKITEEIDRQIRNMPGVVQYCYQKAIELLKATGSDNFEVVLSSESGGQISSRKTDASGMRKPMTRRMVFDEETGHWGSGVPASQHPAERSRPRAYVMPSNGKGIHEELSDAVLLKAALGMADK